VIERKYTKEITWLLRFTEEQDEDFYDILRYAFSKVHPSHRSKPLLTQLLACFPQKETKNEETVYNDLDVDDDGIGIHFDGPADPPISLGRTDGTTSAGGGGAALPGCEAPVCSEAVYDRKKAYSESFLADLRAHARAAAYTANRPARKPDVPDG